MKNPLKDLPVGENIKKLAKDLKKSLKAAKSSETLKRATEKLSPAVKKIRDSKQAQRVGSQARKLAGNPLIQRIFPLAETLENYKRPDFSADLTAGMVVAIMLIPQSMAYALLAGLPPQVGLYAAVLPLILYSLFGTSRTLAVGPVAIVSLMVASAIAPFAASGTDAYVAHAIVLALLSGLFLIALGLARFGAVVNFMSHPVISGFTTAAALIIGFSQFKHLLGVNLDRTYFIPDILAQAWEKIGDINYFTLFLAVISIAMLVGRNGITAFFVNRGWIGEKGGEFLKRAMPLAVMFITTFITWAFSLALNANVKIVGAVPAGLPGFQVPQFTTQMVVDLFPIAVLISIVGFLESVSVAKSLASKRRQKILPNRELVGLGAANIGAAMTGAYPVTGGFSRSVVNFNAGAKTPIAAIVTAVIIAFVLIAFTPFLYHIPKAALAAVIIVAIATLIDIASFRHAWQYSKADGLSYLITFAAVMWFGVEVGILIGIGVSIGLYLWRTSKPHMAVVGRVGDTEHFRNVQRHEVQTYKQILLLRIDENLYFANVSYLEDQIQRHISDNPDIKHLVLIANAVNEIDASALGSLEQMITRLADSGVTMHLAEVKGPVMDRLIQVNFVELLEPGRIFLSTHDAVEALREKEVDYLTGDVK
ncbi:MAG: sulfate permease [Rhizobiaceae bacterium]|nr:sulfate permease [Rhizobiaceae bacterium]